MQAKKRIMEKLLDGIETKNTRKRFSLLSFIVSIATLGLFVFLFSSVPRTIKASEAMSLQPSIYLVFIT